MKGPAMNERWFEFVPGVFFKVLAVTIGLLCLGWAGAIWQCGRISTVDMVGSVICVPIAAYLVHLWIVYARQRDADH
jgi:hypothetical protein